PATARLSSTHHLNELERQHIVPALHVPTDEQSATISRIVPLLTPGAAVTTTRAHVHYVVTEYGIANLHGGDLAERARKLIAVAAPQFREQLTHAAKLLHLL
ncbi:MAG: acetyl-CoA hydrolase/transferase C-terminal domain-containing protein, partial [Ktedonobacterales bacterium]